MQNATSAVVGLDISRHVPGCTDRTTPRVEWLNGQAVHAYCASCGADVLAR